MATMTAPAKRLTLVLIARIPPSGVANFRDYEARVLPLLAVHGGHLERRLSSAEGTREVHIVSFRDRLSFDAYRADPRRAEAAPLLQSSAAELEVMELDDYGTGP